VVADQPDELKPSPAGEDLDRAPEKPLRGPDAIPADLVNSPDPDPSKPGRHTGWRNTDEDPPPTPAST